MVVINDLETLNELEAQAERAIDSAKAQMGDFDEPINWGDLHCVGAEYVFSNSQEEFYRVWIEEADPFCGALQTFIRQHLAENGWNDVDVITEW